MGRNKKKDRKVQVYTGIEQSKIDYLGGLEATQEFIYKQVTDRSNEIEKEKVSGSEL